MKVYHLLMALSLLILIACDPDHVALPIVDNSEEYFPLEPGRYIEYQVDSIVFDDAPGGNSKDTISFQLREEVGTYHLNPPGDTVYYIHRFRRPSSQHPWVLTDVWTARIEDNRVLRTEENLTFHKMTFPLYKGQRWEATAYIPPETQVLIGTENVEAYQYWDARVVGIDEAGDVGAYTFPAGELMRIRQADEDDDIFKRYVGEVYARGIGLVSRTDTILDSRCIEIGDFTPCIGKAWNEHASKGYILSQVITDHN